MKPGPISKPGRTGCHGAKSVAKTTRESDSRPGSSRKSRQAHVLKKQWTSSREKKWVVGKKTLRKWNFIQYPIEYINIKTYVRKIIHTVLHIDYEVISQKYSNRVSTNRRNSNSCKSRTYCIYHFKFSELYRAQLKLLTCSWPHLHRTPCQQIPAFYATFMFITVLTVAHN
jgi:hypothetical protein